MGGSKSKPDSSSSVVRNQVTVRPSHAESQSRTESRSRTAAVVSNRGLANNRTQSPPTPQVLNRGADSRQAASNASTSSVVVRLGADHEPDAERSRIFHELVMDVIRLQISRARATRDASGSASVTGVQSNSQSNNQQTDAAAATVSESASANPDDSDDVAGDHFTRLMQQLLRLERAALILGGNQETAELSSEYLDELASGGTQSEFRAKCVQFLLQLHEVNPPHGECFTFEVSRNHLVRDSFNAIMPFGNTEELKGKLRVSFAGENGVDCGGLVREWFSALSSQLFNPDYGLFQYSAEDRHVVQINPNSGSAVGTEHMDLFRFAGRFMGLAVYHKQLLNATFAPQFCCALLGKPINVDYVSSFDPQYYRSLKYILDNDPSSLELTFSVTEDRFGECVQHDLIPNGRQIAVTQNNKHDYVQAVIDYKFVAAVREQSEALRNAFYELVPERLLSVFDEKELCLLFGGEANIDVQDWRKNTYYSDGYSDKHQVIDWFWQAVTSFNTAQRSQLLQFVTGCSRLPAAGFADLRGSSNRQRFHVAKIEPSAHLPRAHTCFNRLDLPEYKTYEELRSKLLLAVENADVIDGVD